MPCSGGCSTAVGRTCRCSCGGSGHGTGRIFWATMLRDPVSVDVPRKAKFEQATLLRQRTGELVRECLRRFRRQSDRRARVRHKDADASMEYARSVEAIDWLIEHPTEAHQVQWLADQIGEIGSQALVTLSTSQRRRLGDHFWCDTSVALVQVVEELQAGKSEVVREFSNATADLISSEVWRKVERSRTESARRRQVGERRTIVRTRRARDAEEKLTWQILRPIVEKVVNAAVNTAFAPIDAQLQVTLWKLRVITLMLCPDPFSHESVLGHCLQPMASNEISGALHEQLLQFIRRDIDPVST